MRPRSRAVDLFVLGYVAAVAAWSVPAPLQPAAVRELDRWLEPLLLRSGLWQGWDMFAPDPLSIDVSVEAEVLLRDGTWVTWTVPRMETLGYLERYRKERYRKWRERVRLDAYALVWPDAARFAARRVSRPGNPARLVQLVRRWEPIPRPVGPYLPPRPARPVLTREHRFFRYPVAPADLR